MPLCEHPNPDDCPNHGVEAARRRASAKLEADGLKMLMEEFGLPEGEARDFIDMAREAGRRAAALSRKETS